MGSQSCGRRNRSSSTTKPRWSRSSASAPSICRWPTRSTASRVIHAPTKDRFANSSVTTQWGMGKNFDRTGGFGPWMVTADEVPPGGKGLKIMSRLNGKTMQSDNTDNMMFPLAETLVYLTKGMTLEPGDVILTGTPSGVGHARKPEPVWMKAGDTCEIEIENVGVLRNPIADEK